MSILLLLGVAAIFIAPNVIVPQHLERAIVLKSDGNQGAALVSMKALYQAGDRSQKLIYELAKLHLDFGEIEQADALIAAYSDDHPDLIWPRRELLKIREATGTENQHIEALNALYAAEPDQDTFHRLAEHYRINGDFEREARLIEEAALAGYATLEDRLRLGMIKASAGKVPEAILILQDIDRELPDDITHPRFALFNLMIADERPLDAVRYGQTWITRWDMPWATEEFQRIMSAAGYPDLANGITPDENGF
jgi:hypothetical protein